jgi:hypothetical protein
MKTKETMPLRILALLLVFVFGTFLWNGCAHDSVVKEKTVVDSETGETVSVQEVHTETDEESTTVLGTIFDVVGEVLALPFRLVAGFFQFIF